jgi:hypothetical protein
MTKTVLTLAYAGALLFAFAEARAAQQGGAQPSVETKPEPAAPSGEGQSPKSETGETKPETAPGPESGAATPQPEPNGAPASLGDLTREGFAIVTTDFIPAEAVTRQSGKVSSDAIVVTLQKQGATAICFYTLKAYVGKKLTTIPACAVHR